MEPKLQGNICMCGNVWFTIIMPESTPDRCPFCGRVLDIAEPYDANTSDDFIQNEKQQQFDAQAQSDTYKKTLGADKNNISLVVKVCKFCANEIFFDKKDADNATFCPYCDDNLVTPEEYMRMVTGLDPKVKIITNGTTEPEPELEDISTQIIIDELEINSLVDSEVLILKKSFNPFVKEQKYIFKGLDYITMILKVVDLKNDSTEWIAFDTIKYIRKVNDYKSPK